MSRLQLYRVRSAAVQGFLAVSFGAFGAHALPKLLGGLPADEVARRLAWVSTGSHYQLAHAAALLGLAALGWDTRASAWAGRCLFYGPLLFAATLYAMALGAPLWLGAVTPIGGLAMLTGWALLPFSFPA